jgi:signal transduction histidine kinase
MGTESYHKRLEQLDSYLNLEPNRGKKMLNELLIEAKQNDNSTLLAVLSIYQGTYLYYVGQSDSALVYFDKAIRQADRLKNDQLRSTAAIRKLFILQGSNNSAPILTLMQDEYKLAKKRKDTLNMIYSLNGQALCYDNLDSTKACINTYVKALRLAKNSGNDYEYGFLLNNLGLLKLRLNSPEEAIHDFREGIVIARRLKNTRLEVTLRENVGYYYMSVDSMDKAVAEYKNTYELAKNRHFYHLAFNSLVNLGSIERELGNSARCDSLMKSALETAKAEKMMYALSPIYLILAQLELDAGNFGKVPALLDSVMRYSSFSSPTEYRENMYLLRYQMAEKQGDFETALEFYKKLTDLRDSANRNGHMQMITELQLKYDLERKEKEYAEDKREYETKTNQLRQNIALTFIFILLILGSFVIYYFRQKHKRESEFSAALINKLEEEKGRIARDLHDGLGQSLVILKNKFNKHDPNDPESVMQVENAFTETIEEVRSISRSLIPPELRRLGLRKSIHKMLKEIEGSTDIVAISDLEILEELKLESSDEIRIYRIIQELTNNTIKHSEASSLKIEFIRKGNQLTIIYQDNGKGMDEDASKNQNSVGMKSIVQRLKYLNGTIRIQKQTKGFKAVLRIKLKES